MSEQTTQQQYLSVHALTSYLKRKFDVDPYLQRVWVIGEISNFRPRPNGHQYFSLKDERARINAVMYKGAFNKVPFKVEEGMKVLAVGRITLYEPSGQYQLTIDSMEPDGVGALYQALEQLKQKFQAAGLFDLPKKAIPVFPKKIAVITSPTGAVIRDILTTIQRRFPIVEVTVFPTRVQGKEATAEIVAAFNKVENVAEEFDTVILARGGGSIEDLWCFNEEAVAQAILACSLPVISSIGHETDTTLADLVADIRAATPTAAAEIAVPVLTDLLERIVILKQRMNYAMKQKLTVARKQFERSNESYVLKQPERLYQAYIQQLDLSVQRLEAQQHRYFEQLTYRLNYLMQRLNSQHPNQQLKHWQQIVNNLDNQLKQQFKQVMQQKQQNLKHQAHLLDAYSPLKSMSRGYALIEHEQQHVTTIDQLSIGDEMKVQFVDGQVVAEVKSIHEEKLI
ncbi:exodeoxyribonuclease VII large subunit [Fundicoccus ignavus]|uniref:Exodeoxyribonuclease 7 large subunit n=1 Tax=Fundicoccus ignavus TaxID=2664442 RepID=A0A6I2GKU8_9LACT|nr:exodeoxyribonuclease VII large subunit [Fundicoccus ignavus]MRI81872.1 exodeoxyribonuclease VII large subunit [Fundicoccus ignavus]MRI85188.1 exodeoxyribonuclease VII large subunit [Fundicoccus ignavus]MRJ48159.1 exodeoxyribonuclease VII large subunit [Fundicoccus ignavus]